LLHDIKIMKTSQNPRRGSDMIAITEKAKEQLEKTLRGNTVDHQKAMRIVTTASSERPLGFILDEEDEGDLVVESEEGKSVLLIGPALGAALEGTVIDYGETETESGFIIYKQGYIN
jgi:Fe-S cluster assembly iron-binding protein IscA